MNTKKPFLDSWTFGIHANELCLFGIVKNHPRLEDGKRVVTSRVASIDFMKKQALTQYTNYDLGEVSDEVWHDFQMKIEEAEKLTECDRYSTICGADAWLQFDDSDPPEYQALNGKCVVLHETKKNGNKVTDEYDPLDPQKLLEVEPSKLRR